MTTDEMAMFIIPAFVREVQERNAGVRLEDAVPAGVTPLAWQASFAPPAEDIEPADFAERYGHPAAAVLAQQAIASGCDVLGPVTVEDRPAVSTRSQGGRGALRTRPRAIVVRATGWSSKPAPAHEHIPVWPHAMGRKGDRP